MSAAPPRWSMPALLAAATIVVYVVGSRFYLVGSLQPGDVWMMPVVAVLLATPVARRDLVALLGGGYGLAALALSGFLLLAAMQARSPLESAKFAAQLVFTIWFVVPAVAVGVARMPDPLGFFRRAGVAYVLVFLLGVVLLFGAGSDLIVVQTGIGRIFPQFAVHVLQFALVAATVAALAFGGGHPWRNVGLLLLSLVPVLLNASRTGLAGFALVGLLAAIGSAAKPKRLPAILGGATLLAATGLLLSTSEVVREVWRLRTLSASGFLEDEVRVASVQTSLDAIRAHVGTLLFGEGWGTSGGDIVVHNFVVQVTHEGGVLVLLALAALWALPVWWVATGRRGTPAERAFVVLLMALFALYWSLNALSVERVYWLAYAVALGVAFRLREPVPAAAPAPAAVSA